MKKITYFFFLLFALAACSNLEQSSLSFSSSNFQLSIDRQGYITKFLDLQSEKNYLATDTLAPFLSIRKAGEVIFPQNATFSQNESLLSFQFSEEITADVFVQEKESHLTFELKTLSPIDNIEMIIWGPYPTSINQIIGETIGVVRGESFALGIQALNPKTLGGYPWNDNDCMPQLDMFESGDFSDISEEGKRYVLYRVEAAKPEAFGSTLQAYCRNRDQERITENWNHKKYTIPTFDDGGVIGSKIAFFGCPVEETLTTLEAIELAEGLPHPTIDGQWGKTARSANAAYMILGFGEEDVDQAIAYTKQAGLRYLYHPGPFKNWGQFDLGEQFPSGWDGLKAAVDKAKTAGLYVGVHTLSNFITTDDPYVTPVPDPRLAKVGSSKIIENIDASQTEILIAEPDFFNQYKNNNLKTVQIGSELIRYGQVSEHQPWRLIDCQRGAFDTQAQAHQKDDVISKLADHGYKVFLTNPELTLEMSGQLAKLFNYAGLQQISFDGIEGNRSTGMGNYAEILFANTWHQKLKPELKEHYIADASRTSHYFWHIYTRMNWGEPWYAGFRESQTEYRLKNQPYFQRNLMPAMLGWFSLRPNTSIEDIEWMLARSAGFDAGYGFVSNYKVLKENGYTREILAALGQWEEARMADVFSEEQKLRMQDIAREFRLKNTASGQWKLTEFTSNKFQHEAKVRQPGEPLYSEFSFDNPSTEQPLQFILTASDANVQNIRLELDHFKMIELPIQLQKGETLKYTGEGKAILYTENWQKKGEVSINANDLLLKPGAHQLQVDGSFSASGENAMLKVEVRMVATVEDILMLQ